MAYQANAAYMSELIKRVKTPNYFVQVKAWGGQDRWIAMSPVKNPTRSYLIGLENIKAASQSITPEEGRSSIGVVDFALQDKNDRITALMASAVRHKEVVLWGGYEEVDESYYIPLATNRVDDFSLGKNLIEYMFKTADIQRSIKRDVFKPKVTSLTAPLNVGETQAFVADPSSFLKVNHPSLGNVGYLRIEDEIIKWTNSGGVDFTIERGQFGTVDVQHASGEEVKEVIAFQEHPLSIALKVLTSTGNGTNGTYDTLPAHWALGIDQSLINIATWESEGADWLDFTKTDFTQGYQFRFLYDDKVEGKKWLEDEILKVLNSYAPVGIDGTMSLKAFSPPVPFSSLEKLDEKVMEVKGMKGGLSEIVNIALFEYDHDLIQDKYLTNIEYSDGQSITDHGESERFEIKSRGIRSDLNGAAIVLDRWNRLKQRYSKPVPTVNVTAFYMKHLLEAGEMVNFSYPDLPDIERGQRGMSEKIVEVVNKRFDLIGGAVHYDLMLTGFGRRYATYAPDTASTTYGAASQAERDRYGFYADDTDKVGGVDEGYRHG